MGASRVTTIIMLAESTRLRGTDDSRDAPWAGQIFGAKRAGQCTREAGCHRVLPCTNVCVPLLPSK